MSDSDDSHDFIIEYISMGNSVKVTAIDPESGREVSIVGASGAGKQELGKLAVRKLLYVLNRDEKDA